MATPMNSELPLVSIITPSYNQASFLEDAIRSVLEQDYPRIELIVIDGGSTDGSLEILQRYRDRLAHCISEPDQGQADAINKGFQLARGEIVAWLNSDDVYLPGAVKEAVNALRDFPDAGMVYADGLMVDADLVLLDRHYYKPLSIVDLLSFEVLLQPTVFMRRAVLEEVGWLNDAYHLILDHELWIRIACRYPIVHINSFWALERTHAEAKTISQAQGFVEEAQRVIAWAGQSNELGNLVQNENKRIKAGLHVFAGRRLIDSGEYKRAFRYLMQAATEHPPTVVRYWYKVVQAGLSAIGLSGVFEWYRTTRRRIIYGTQHVEPL
ncbi:MAG: glycosyltransferase [Anaerolineales bacterium]|nr:glycosyltransferase [Anaerolineales bacterium]